MFKKDFSRRSGDQSFVSEEVANFVNKKLLPAGVTPDVIRITASSIPQDSNGSLHMMTVFYFAKKEV